MRNSCYCQMMAPNKRQFNSGGLGTWYIARTTHFFTLYSQSIKHVTGKEKLSEVNVFDLSFRLKVFPSKNDTKKDFKYKTTNKESKKPILKLTRRGKKGPHVPSFSFDK